MQAMLKHQIQKIFGTLKQKQCTNQAAKINNQYVIDIEASSSYSPMLIIGGEGVE